MWITRCLPVCQSAVVSHPFAVGIPAAVTTIGAGAALAIMLSTPPSQPQLPCGCHQVWVAPVLPMTPKDYAKAIAAAGAVALAGVPLADAPGGLVYATPSSLVPANAVPADFPAVATQREPQLVPTAFVPTILSTPVPKPIPTPIPIPTPVPEPAGITILATALAALVFCKRARRRV